LREDLRSGVVVYLAHCLLNQNTKVPGLVSEATIEASRRVIDLLRGLDVGLAQMPCPEFTHIGLRRPRQTRDQYDNTAYREHCRDLARGIAGEIEDYQRAGVEVACILGIEGSPSCGVEWTTRGWREAHEKTRERGILIEELSEALRERGLKIPIIGIPEKRKYGELEKALKGVEEAVREASRRRRKTYL
jgi:predicted secreted protein